MTSKKQQKKSEMFPLPGIEPGAARYIYMKAGDVNPYTTMDSYG